jgi:hypothetical protein
MANNKNPNQKQPGESIPGKYHYKSRQHVRQNSQDWRRRVRKEKRRGQDPEPRRFAKGAFVDFERQIVVA